MGWRGESEVLLDYLTSLEPLLRWDWVIWCSHLQASTAEGLRDHPFRMTWPHPCWLLSLLLLNFQPILKSGQESRTRSQKSPFQLTWGLDRVSRSRDEESGLAACKGCRLSSGSERAGGLNPGFPAQTRGSAGKTSDRKLKLSSSCLLLAEWPQRRTLNFWAFHEHSELPRLYLHNEVTTTCSV